MKKNIFGFVFISIAILMILNLLGYELPIRLDLLIYTIVLIAIVISSIIKRQFYGFFLSLAFLIFIYKEHLNIVNINIMQLVIIALLLAIGFSIIFNKNKYNYKNHHTHYKSYHNKDNYNSESYSDVVEGVKYNDSNEEIISYSSKFSSTTKFIKSDNLKELRIDNHFGNLNVYLDNAKLAKEGATVFLSNSFGDVKLYIPKEYKITNKVDTILGNVTININRESEYYTNSITIIGTVNLGNLLIVSI